MVLPIRLSGVCERDIDLLLLEELIASASFRKWFLSQAGIKNAVDVISAEHSVATPNGESDLELSVRRRNGGIVKILTENKVDALFQPRQPERYRERAERYIQNGECSEVRTVVIAPSAYFEGRPADEFDTRLTYEALLKWFQEGRDLGNRKAYKTALVKAAIDRGQVGWKLIPDTAATHFWETYWELAYRDASELRMPKPSKKPATSSFIMFKPLSLPRDITLWHKLSYGNVDLQFKGMGERLPDLDRQYGKHLVRPLMQIDKAARSAVIRIKVPEIDMTAPFTNSEPAVRVALKAAVRLLNWYNKLQSR